MLKSKTAAETLTIMTEMVMPNDTNSLGFLMGGNLMRMIDIAGAISAQKHANKLVVTASVDNVSFVEPIPLGNVVTLEAKVSRSFNTSMEVVVKVYSENIPAGIKRATNQAYLTFVALGDNGKPTLVPESIPETKEEKAISDGALRRRQLRLVLAGRLKPQDATELKALFGL